MSGRVSAERFAFLREFIRSHPDGMGIREISRKTGIPKSSLWPVLDALRTAGIACCTHEKPGYPDSRWCPTEHVERVRKMVGAGDGERQILRPAAECKPLKPRGPRSVFDLARFA